MCFHVLKIFWMIRWSRTFSQWWKCQFWGEAVYDHGGGFRDTLSDIAEELCPSSDNELVALPFFIRSPNQVSDDLLLDLLKILSFLQHSYETLSSCCRHVRMSRRHEKSCEQTPGPINAIFSTHVCWQTKLAHRFAVALPMSLTFDVKVKLLEYKQLELCGSKCILPCLWMYY